MRAIVPPLLAMSLGAACGAPAAPPAGPAISNSTAAAPAVPPPSPCELGWLEHAERLVVTEDGEDHGSILHFRAELAAGDGAFAGKARGSYQSFPDKPWHMLTQDLRFPRAQAAAALAGIARGVWVPEDPDGRRGLSHEAGVSFSVAVEASARLGGAEYHTRLEALDGGHDDPQPWRVPGCERQPTHDARLLLTREYRKLEQLVQHDRIQRRLWDMKP